MGGKRIKKIRIVFSLFDPYTVFAKTTVHLGKPLALFFNNALVELLEQFDIYSVSIKRQNNIPFQVLTVTLIFFTGILFLSFFKARLYCNSICPVGLIMGIISQVSFFKFHIDKQRCKHCALCESVCKAGCIDVQNLRIDSSRCVGCFNCLDVCDNHLISYTHRLTENRKQPVLARRYFLLNSAVATSAVLSTCTPFRLEKAKLFSQNTPVMPPGSLNFDHFTKNCTACHLCISVCPTQVLEPTLIGCGACEHACPTIPNAILVSSVLVHQKARKYMSDRKFEVKTTIQEQGFPF